MTASLRSASRVLGANSVSAMAQELGLHWPPPPPISVRDLITRATTALVLSGGGAKGSFELGVVQYLYAHGAHPHIICSTSVGSVNGLKLAEGEGSADQGLQGLTKIWLNMQTDSDMYVEDDWFQNSPQWIRDALNDNFGPFSIPELIPAFASGLIPLIGIDAVVRAGQLSDFVTTFKNAHGIYNLGPIANLARNNVNLQLLGKIKLRMAMVGLASGQVRYASELGRLLTDPSLPSGDAGSPPVDVIQAMLASASIPVFFDMQQLAGDWYVDGGIRQLAPVKAAVAMGAMTVYAVVAPIPLGSDTDYTNKGLIDIGTRVATDITIDEITTDNIAPAGFGWNASVIIIRPNVEVESSRTIDPGLIRINVAYGWMRGYDVLSLQPNPGLRASLIVLSDGIASTRKQIWDLENSIRTSLHACYGQAGRNQVLFLQQTQAAMNSTVPRLRALKNQLMGLVQCRLATAGQDSTPGDAEAWANSWEPHYNWGTDAVFDPAYVDPATWPASPWDAFHVYVAIGYISIPSATLQPTTPPGGCPPPAPGTEPVAPTLHLVEPAPPPTLHPVEPARPSAV
jgi:predicted acylesterase/phospholipase RssA